MPHGTVLGPLLFLCHINDLPDGVKSTIRLFVDDCLLHRSVRNRDNHLALKRDLRQQETWAHTWGMRFNAKKCYLMSINQKFTHFYQLDSHILQQVPDNPYLGVTLSDNMKWNYHISKISKRANSNLGFLKRNLKHCPQDSRRTAYLTLLRSTLEYSSIVLDPYLQKDIENWRRYNVRLPDLSPEIIFQEIRVVSPRCKQS